MPDLILLQELKVLITQAQFAGHLPGLLSWMAAHGQCIDLTWDEDSNEWECSWLPGGKRYIGRAQSPTWATIYAAQAAQKECRMEGNE